ncbi:MAG: hypothetical protein ACYTFG_09265 [Planctomycetota bacterium]|jgi:hypothetical protein
MNGVTARLLVLGLAALVVGAGRTAAEENPAGEKKHPALNAKYWSMVNKAHAVLEGTLDVPVEEIRKANETGKHDYVSVKVAVSKVYKGDFIGGEFTFAYYPKPVPYLPSPKKVTSHHGKRAILFLLRAGRKDKWYFIHEGMALTSHTKEIAALLLEEARLQRDVIAKPEKYLTVKRDTTFEKVQALIEVTQEKDNAKGAYDGLLELGKKALPAMVMLMDDRRDLPVKRISFPNPPGHWEGVRHYGPKKVVDLLDAILNHLFGHGGNIVNGGTEFQRARAVEEWRIFLYKLQCDERAKKSK